MHAYGFFSVVPVSESLGHGIAWQLRLEILAGKLSPGSRISEPSLAERFGVSRAPVRDALRTLATEGVIFQHRRGAEIARITPQFIGELYDLRQLLEGFAFVKTADNLDNQGILHLRSYIEHMQTAVSYLQHEQFAAADMHFHDLLLQRAGHQRIYQTWLGIRDLSWALMYVTNRHRQETDPQSGLSVVADHETVLDSLAQRDVVAIGQAIAKHYARAPQDVMRLPLLQETGQTP